MEASFFRFAVDELFSRINGLRIQKVFMPAPGVWTISFSSSHNLILFITPRKGGFFLSAGKPPNPPDPPAPAMWLRKRIKNQRLVSCTSFWPVRKTAFGLSGTGDYLILDIRKGLSLDSDIAVPSPVSWPDQSQIADKPEIWRDYPQISPPLRKALSTRTQEKALYLLDSLSQGRPEGYYIFKNSKGGKEPGCFLPDPDAEHQVFSSALQAAEAYGWPKVHALITDAGGRRRVHASKLKRLEKNLAKTRQDRQRLSEMVRQAELGSLIKSNLHNLDPGAKKQDILLPDEHGRECRIRLDPAKTILENMESFFKKAAKGRRGLQFVRKRENELCKSIDKLQDPVFIDGPAADRKKNEHVTNPEKGSQVSSIKFFRSSDGFSILRARNRQAGQKLLSRQASPHDLWFHVQDGPGAHVILKRDHELSEVPERTLKEAACLAALASYRKNDSRAEVLCARVRDVRRAKGLEQGKVLVRETLRSIPVKIDSSLESSLKITR